MIPPQMLMETAAEHAEQLRRTGAGHRRSRREPLPHRAPGRHGVRLATGRLLIRIGTAVSPSSPKGSAWTS